MLLTLGSLGINRLPQYKTVETACSKFLHRLYEEMKKSDNHRKFFTLVTLLFMIAVQFVDFSASTEIANGVKELAEKSTENTAETTLQVNQVIAAYGSLKSKPQATLLAACLSMFLFAFSPADRLLTILHDNEKKFFFAALATLFFLFVSSQYFIVGEIMEILLMAALIYPDKVASPDPKGRKSIPIEHNRNLSKNAA